MHTATVTHPKAYKPTHLPYKMHSETPTKAQRPTKKPYIEPDRPRSTWLYMNIKGNLSLVGVLYMKIPVFFRIIILGGQITFAIKHLQNAVRPSHAHNVT